MTPFAYLIEIDPILKSDLFTDLNEKSYKYYYFKKNEIYYLFLFGESVNNLTEYLTLFLKIRKELNTRKRKIRSVRGFLFYVLEIIEGDENSVTVLKTNLAPFFWKRVQNVLKQNRNDSLFEFLFETQKVVPKISSEFYELKNEVHKLKSQISFIKEQIHLKKPKAQHTQKNKQEFRSFNSLSLELQLEIISKSKKLRQQNRISLADYYEGINHPDSLFQEKGFSIKYESIRKHPLYKNKIN